MSHTHIQLFTGGCWLSCAGCAELIEVADLDALLARVDDKGVLNPIDVRYRADWILPDWRTFLDNRTGPRLPFGPGERAWLRLAYA